MSNPSGHIPVELEDGKFMVVDTSFAAMKTLESVGVELFSANDALYQAASPTLTGKIISNTLHSIAGKKIAEEDREAATSQLIIDYGLQNCWAMARYIIAHMCAGKKKTSEAERAMIVRKIAQSMTPTGGFLSMPFIVPLFLWTACLLNFGGWIWTTFYSTSGHG